MKQAIKSLLLILISILTFAVPCKSQDGNPLQFLPGVSQSSFFDPAHQNESKKLIIGFPLISGASFDWKSNFSLDYIFSKNFTYSLGNFYDELGEPGDATGTFDIPMFYLSLKKYDHNFSLSIRDRIYATGYFDHEILKFLDQGIQPYYGQNQDFGPVIFKSYYFRELAVGYAYEIWEGFSVGVRPKILFARFYYDVTELNFEVTTNEESEQLILKPNGNYTLSAPVEVTYIEEIGATNIRPNPRPNDYFFNFHNLSPAIDLGINYRFDNGLQISAAILDLGYIGFKHNTYDVEFTDAIRYSRDDLYQSKFPDEPNYKEPKLAIQAFSDSIPYITTAGKVSKREIERIPLKFTASLKQKLTNSLDLGVSGQLTYTKKYTDNYISGFMHTQLGEKVNLAATVSLLNFHKFLPGVAASYTGRRAQFYLSTNNITGFVAPTSAKYLNLSFGVNFLFSTTEK
ncbi:DUF5723 family protein [Maribellus sediminis]|uniref:DUF5723 family protein n=1 Tax=Maribellus sediminis TaxID=2696285 RepID=UPI00143064DA|nr:DUF5723 family protein [Maribellus sediminis]